MTDELDQAGSPTAVRTPPYVGFKTFGTLIEDLKTNGLPPQIDRSVLKRFSGGVGSQLIMALRALGLVDDRNGPTDMLSRLVDTHGTEEFRAAVRDMLQAGYPFLAKLDLKTATPSMFAEAFRSNTSAKEDVLRKCRTFYLHAAQYAGVEIGPRLLSGGAPKAPSNGSARRRPAAPKARAARRDPPDAGQATDGHTRHHHAPQQQDLTAQLLAKFPSFDPTWSEDLKTAWFAGFEKLMTSATKKEPG